MNEHIYNSKEDAYQSINSCVTSFTINSVKDSVNGNTWISINSIITNSVWKSVTSVGNYVIDAVEGYWKKI